MTTKDEFFTWFKAEHLKLHKAWSAEVGTPGYHKEYWIRQERNFHSLARLHAEALGIEPPYLRP